MSEKIQITTDSTADLLPPLDTEYGIYTIPLHINLNGKTYREMIDITPTELFHAWEDEGKMAKTSAGPIGEYEDIFRKLTGDGFTVVHISLSSELSTSYRNATLAAAEFPGKVFVVDSMQMSMAQGILCIEAARLRDAGKSAAEIAETITAMRHKSHVSAIFANLDYPAAGGRVPKFIGIGATALKLRPSAHQNGKTGKIDIAKIYRGPLHKCRLQYLTDTLETALEKMDKRFAFVLRTEDLPDEDFHPLVAFAKEKLRDVERIVDESVGCLISLNCGSKAFGFAWLEA
ncbi:MAG: DegV family protein [Oscillospiraceae bacterium]|jgi:DegV family protein with EDD domain|nr:DegV family protein [Oscillospiraceae bacterium]